MFCLVKSEAQDIINFGVEICSLTNFGWLWGPGLVQIKCWNRYLKMTAQ